MQFCCKILSSRITHFFRRFVETEKQNPLLECMSWSSPSSCDQPTVGDPRRMIITLLHDHNDDSDHDHDRVISQQLVILGANHITQHWSHHGPHTMRWIYHRSWSHRPKMMMMTLITSWTSSSIWFVILCSSMSVAAPPPPPSKWSNILTNTSDYDILGHVQMNIWN